MNNALLYIGGFLVVVLASLFAVPHFVDWNSYRGVFEEEASRVLGRDVRIGGTVNLRLLPAPYISLEKLKIADPSSTSGDSLFRAESFTVWLSVPPLLKGVLEANKIEVRRPVVQLVASPEGGGNWQSLTINSGQMPLIPKGVSLQSVTITDGALVVGTTARPEMKRLLSINGELMAEALNGPFKFSGSLIADGNLRDVRLATSAAEPDQDVRFKVTVRTLDSGNNYTLSGRVLDLKQKAKFEGDLSADLNLSLLGRDEAQAASGAVPRSELTAKVTGDTAGVEFKDIALALAQGTTPQLVSGSAKISWPERTQIELSLASKWLDFDRLTGAGKAVPLDAGRRLFEALAAALPNEADTSTNVTFDQVTLGGDAVSDVRLQARRAGGALELKGVRASLPGGARVEFDGELNGADAARVVTGSIALSGQSLQRFMAWGTGKDGLVAAHADGPFALEGDLSLSHTEVAVRNATAEIAGMPVAGEIQASLQGRHRMLVVVEGDRLDAGALWPGSLKPEFAAALLRIPLAPASAQADPEQAKGVASGPATQDMDIRVRLRAKELADGDRVLKNVDADLSIENGALAMPKLNFTTADGLSVKLEGETKVADNADKTNGESSTTGQARQTGVVRGMILAPDGAAIARIAQALGLDAGAANPRSLAALAPLNLAGSLQLGARTGQSADLQVDGVAGKARISGAFLLDGGWSGWRTSPADISLTADGDDIGRTLSALIGTENKMQETGTAHSGRLAVKALSDAGGNFLANASLRAAGLEAVFDGTTKFDAQTGWQTAGDVRLNTDDARTPMQLAGLAIGKGAGQFPMTGLVRVTSDKSGQKFVLDGLQAGGSKVSGQVAVAFGQNGGHASPSIEADIAADAGSVPALLAMLTSASVAVAAPLPEPEEKATAPGKKRRQPLAGPVPVPALAAASGDASIWPTESFDSGLLAHLNGRIKATFGTLSIEPGLGMTEAVMDSTLTPGRIITQLTGKALGGDVQSSVLLDRDPVGVKLAAAFALKAGGADNSNATLKFDAEGRASSPAGLIAEIKGKGELVLAADALHVNSPAALTPVAQAALEGKGPVAGEDLALAIRSALKDSSQSLGGFSVPLTVGDGIVRFDKVRLDAAAGRSQFDAVIQLDTLRLLSEWQIQPKIERVGAASGAERLMLAPVTVVYNGKLKDIASLEPEIAVTALERELAVRKMEHDVEQLERLRKADQAQAAAENERRKAAEAERLRAAATAKASRDAAAAAGAAQIPAVPDPTGQTSGNGAPPTGSEPNVQPQRRDEGASSTPTDPAAVSPEGAAAADDPQLANGGNANRPQNNLGRSASSWRPLVRKKKVQESWKPFQVPPY